jgi:quercetin dioxygenase-like cupin family protein/NAD(P)-dependent dehydrogenase (short-subunit alcohol dehydrogenase family)
MHHVARLDWSFAEHPIPSSPTSSGLARSVLVGPGTGSAHTELAIGHMDPGGWIARHVHSYEEALYVLEGVLIFETAGRVHRLVPGDFALNPIGVPHGIAATPDQHVRWLSVNTPPRRPLDARVPDTIYARTAPDTAALLAAAEPLGPATAPAERRHYDGTPPQAEALAVTDPARGRHGYGCRAPRLQRDLGEDAGRPGVRADFLTMFTVDYEVGGAAQAHDHPFEETYVFLAGTVQAELDGKPYTFGPGDVAFAPVGSIHGFWNEGPDRVRWIETQAPQPPARFAYRWEPSWAAVAERGVEAWPGRTTAAEPAGAGRRRAGWLTREPSSSSRTRAIGFEIAKHYVSRSRGLLTGQSRETVDAAVAALDGRATGLVFDLAEPESIAPALASVGPVRHLVLVAIDRDQNSIREYDIAGATRLTTLKLVGYAEVVHALLDRLDESSSIVMFGGQARFLPYVGSTTVTTVNGGVEGLTRALVHELKPIRVNCIHPGIVGNSPYWENPPVLRRCDAGPTPTGRLVTMADIVAATVPAREPGPQRRRAPGRRRAARDVGAGPRGRIGTRLEQRRDRRHRRIDHTVLPARRHHRGRRDLDVAIEQLAGEPVGDGGVLDPELELPVLAETQRVEVRGPGEDQVVRQHDLGVGHLGVLAEVDARIMQRLEPVRTEPLAGRGALPAR